jgi:ATP-dependent exoDNAse (exonuclease V) beta subunit
VLDRLFADPGAARPDTRPGSTASDLALAVGSAVHRALETIEPEMPLDLARLETQAREVLATRLAAEDVEPALRRALRLLHGLASGRLRDRLDRLRDRIVARELPVLLPPDPEGDGPLGSIAGALDLVYRDPETDELVVVDYKTDQVEGDREVAERARAYRSQAELYRRALREALSLPAMPRFELWFLNADRVEVIG